MDHFMILFNIFALMIKSIIEKNKNLFQFIDKFMLVDIE